MNATITQDSRQGRGHGIIVITGAPAVSGSPSYSIQASSTQDYLTGGGCWIGQRELITPERFSQDRDTLHIGITPAQLSQLDALETYRITLGESGEACMLRLPDVLPEGCIPAVGSTGTMPDAPYPRPKPAQTAAPAAPAAPPVPPENPAPAPEPALDMPCAAPAKKSNLPLIIAVAAVLAAIAAGLFWFTGTEKESAPGPDAASERVSAPEPAQIPAAGESAPQPVPAQAGPSQPEAGQPGAALPARQQAQPFLTTARKHLAGDADPDESVRLAKPLRVPAASESDADGAFLLLEDAAQQGNAEAMLLLAQFYDPLNTLPRGTIQPDLRQAHDWYAKAADSGVAGAAQALTALRAEAQKKADAGDSDAAALIQNW